MRKLIINRINELLLSNAWYADYLRGFDPQTDFRVIHSNLIKRLDDLSDQMLLATYEALSSGRKLVIQWTEVTDEQARAWVWVNGYSGAMLADGSIHT